MDPEDPRHGTYAGGRVHRADNEDVCSDCARAEARYQNERELDRMAGRPREVPAVGTQRRVQSLVTLGHGFTDMAEALDVSAQAVHNLANRRLAYVRSTTAASVHDLFERWSMRLPSEETGIQRKRAQYARTVGRKCGWPPPLAWDDIDDPDETPKGLSVQHRAHARLVATKGRRELLDELIGRGASISEAVRVIGITQKGIERWCERNGCRDVYMTLVRREKRVRDWYDDDRPRGDAA